MAILVLESRQHKGFGELETAVIGHIYPTRASSLGVDDDDAVGSVGAIEGCSRGARQCTDALDVVGIDIASGVTRLTCTSKDVLGLLTRQVLHGDAVNDIQHIVVAVDRFGSAHHYTTAAARARCTGIDGHTGDLTGQRIDEIGVLNRHQGITVHLLHVVGQRFGLFLDAQSGHNDLTYIINFSLLQGDGQNTAVNPHIARVVAHITHRESRPLRCFNAETTIKISGGAHSGALDNHSRPDEGFAVLVKHLSLHLRRLDRAALRLRHRRCLHRAPSHSERQQDKAETQKHAYH